MVLVCGALINFPGATDQVGIISFNNTAIVQQAA